MRHLSRLAAFTLALAGCNYFSGADDIELSTEATTGGSAAPAYLPADGVSLASVAIYQGVERIVAKDGAGVAEGVPIVAGRDALVRLFYAVNADYDKEPVIARLFLDDGEPLEVTAPLGAGSTLDVLTSTLNFDVPGERVTTTTSFRAEILQAAAKTTGDNAAAVFPAEGTHPLYATSAGPSLKLVLVPIAYGADGSGRLPDTSPEQLERYRNTFYKLYPTPAVDVRVVEQPLVWNAPVLANFSGWQDLLNAMIDVRKNGGAKHEEFWYGVFSPSATFESYCGGGCVAGLSLLGDDPNQAWLRAGIGLGFTGEGVTMTAVHEIGHEHGRNHAPCGTNQGLDLAFPTQGAILDAWGFDLIARTLVAKDTNKDFMSYCGPAWITAYTYSALLSRLQTVNAAAMASRVSGARGGGERARSGAPHAESYERIGVGADGTLTWLAPLELDEPARGEQLDATVTSDAGDEPVTAQYFPYSHGGGGLLLVPRGEAKARAVGSRFGRIGR